jgi:hypothetical protein
LNGTLFPIDIGMMGGKQAFGGGMDGLEMSNWSMSEHDLQ